MAGRRGITEIAYYGLRRRVLARAYFYHGDNMAEEPWCLYREGKVKTMSLDLIDRKILRVIQSDFPLVSRPYLQVAETVGITEKEVLDRIGHMQEEGLIRLLGGLFESRMLGYTGTLCAMRVPPEDIERVADIINEYLGVTHNYLRNHEYNVWFTLLAESASKLGELLEEIRQKTGISHILNLPAINLFKVRVNFDL